MDLKYVMAPESVAIVGSTDKQGSFGRYACENALRGKFADKVYFVNPKREGLFGRSCYKSLEDLPVTVDCVEICTPGKTVNDILRQAGRLEIHGAVVYASGFAEDRSTEGHLMEKEMIDICRQYDIALIGPNCVGVANALDKVYLWGLNLPEELVPEEGGTGIIAQSGSLGSGISHRPNVNASMLISTGNGGVVTLEMCMEFMVDNPGIGVVAAYMEGVKDGRKFEQVLAKAAKINKPIVILKGGRSAAGAKSVASHTGALATDDAVFESLFKKYNVIRADSMDEFICITQILNVMKRKPLAKKGVAIVSFSGGEATVMSDLCWICHLDLPELQEETKRKIEQYIPSFAAAKNPLDATTAMFTAEDDFFEVMRAIGTDEAVGQVILSMEVTGEADGRHNCSMNVLERYSKIPEAHAPVCAYPMYEGTRNLAWVNQLASFGVPVLCSGVSGLNALRKVMEHACYEVNDHRLEAVDKVCNPKDAKALSEVESKEWLKECRIALPPSMVLKTREDLEKAAAEVGFPAVMKVVSKDILHKSDIGGVVVGIANKEDAQIAYNQIMRSCTEKMPEAAIEGILFEKMLEKGLEFIIGIKNDSLFGPFILLGMGGIFAEVFKDTAMLPCPVSNEEALSMINGLKVKKLLDGYRGDSPKDIEGLCAMLVRVSEFAAEHADEITEMDINPVIVGNDFVAAADALIIRNGK